MPVLAKVEPRATSWSIAESIVYLCALIADQPRAHSIDTSTTSARGDPDATLTPTALHSRSSDGAPAASHSQKSGEAAASCHSAIASRAMARSAPIDAGLSASQQGVHRRILTTIAATSTATVAHQDGSWWSDSGESD